MVGKGITKIRAQAIKTRACLCEVAVEHCPILVLPLPMYFTKCKE